MSVKKADADKTEERIHTVEEALSKTEKFIEANQKIILIVVAALIVVILGFFGLRKYYIEPKEKEAQGQMFMAEMYFENDSLNKALNGDGQYPGFLEIIDQYGLTKASNLAKYYAGICYLKMGDFEEAIRYLKKFNGQDELAGPMATGAIGDAYMELGDINEAISYYTKAAEQSTNEFTAPLFLMKAAASCELQGDYRKALKLYRQVKEKYSRSYDAREIDKYISYAEGMAEK
jgi:tetratricopeptide (TPR) repeat protein